jgi:hypothetical protein
MREGFALANTPPWTAVPLTFTMQRVLSRLHPYVSNVMNAERVLSGALYRSFQTQSTTFNPAVTSSSLGWNLTAESQFATPNALFSHSWNVPLASTIQMSLMEEPVAMVEDLEASSVLKKRRKKMRKHKHKKLTRRMKHTK